MESETAKNLAAGRSQTRRKFCDRDMDLLDKATAATVAGAPAVGRRIEVRWTDAWEAGTVVEHVVQLEHDAAVVRVRVEYDDREEQLEDLRTCLLYTSPSPRDRTRSRMPSSA